MRKHGRCLAVNTCCSKHVVFHVDDLNYLKHVRLIQISIFSRSLKKTAPFSCSKLSTLFSPQNVIHIFQNNLNLQLTAKTIVRI